MNLQIDQTILNKATVIKIALFPQFYECAEYQMIKLFECLYGDKVLHKELKNRDEEEFFLDSISSMLTTLALELDYNLNDNYKEALSRHLMLHSIMPVGSDNLVMRDYYNPVIMNHFTFYMYLSEYMHGYKDLINVPDKAALRKQIYTLAAFTNILIFHGLNLASIEHIVDKVVDDWGDIIEFGSDKKSEQIVHKFEKSDCKRNFTMQYYCQKSDYVEWAMKRTGNASEWIQQQIIQDKVPMSEVDQMKIRYYTYRFLEKEFFGMAAHIRASIQPHIRSAIHSTISDLVVVNGNYLKTILPNVVLSKIKARDIPFWVETRLENEKWLKIYSHRNSNVFSDLLALKTLEMNYMRDQLWDLKTIKRTIKAVSSLSMQPKKERDKAKEKMMQAAHLSFK